MSTPTHNTLNVGKPYNAAWRVVAGPDRDNYNSIESRCHEDRRWVMDAAPIVAGEQDGVKLSNVWRVKQLEPIFNNATAAAEQYMVEDGARKHCFAENRKWREADELFHMLDVRICQGKTVTVRQDLTDSRFYCKHKGGTPIFNYEPPRRRITGQSYATITMSADGVIEHPKPPPVRNSDAPADRSEFTYNGEVPRAAKEYIARLCTLLPHAVRALICVVVWEGKQVGLSVNALSPLPSLCPIEGLVRLAEFWSIIFGEGRKTPRRVREQLEKNRVLTETTYLLNELEARGGTNDLKANLGMIRHSISYMMGLEIRDAAHLESEFMKKEAFDELFDPRSTKTCFIWANSPSLSRVQNIHQYYKHRFYNSDTLGVICYQFLDSVWDQIQGALNALSRLPPESIDRNNLVASLTRAPHYPAHLQRSHLSPELRLEVLSTDQDRAPRSDLILCPLYARS